MNERDVTVVRERLLSTRESTIRAVLDAADQVAEIWEGEGATERAAVVAPLERALDSTGVLERLPDVLAGAVAAIGAELPAEPVAAPPYVTITSQGPVLRATLDGRRLVITIRAFRVERGDEPRYVRDADSPEDALAVAFRSHPP